MSSKINSQMSYPLHAALPFHLLRVTTLALLACSLVLGGCKKPEEAVPTPVLTTALYERFSSRGMADFGDKLLSAMRYEFGGHLEKAAQEGQP